MRDKVFRGFIVAGSAAMLGAVYGTFSSDITIVLVSVVSGLVATGVGWLGFIRDLRRDERQAQTSVR